MEFFAVRQVDGEFVYGCESSEEDIKIVEPLQHIDISLALPRMTWNVSETLGQVLNF